MAFNVIEFVSITTVVIAATTAALILPLKKPEAVRPEAGSTQVQTVAPVTQPEPEPEDVEAKVQEIERDVKEAKRDLDEIKAALRERAKDERRTQPEN